MPDWNLEWQKFLANERADRPHKVCVTGCRERKGVNTGASNKSTTSHNYGKTGFARPCNTGDGASMIYRTPTIKHGKKDDKHIALTSCGCRDNVPKKVLDIYKKKRRYRKTVERGNIGFGMKQHLMVNGSLFEIPKAAMGNGEKIIINHGTSKTVRVKHKVSNRFHEYKCARGKISDWEKQTVR